MTTEPRTTEAEEFKNALAERREESAMIVERLAETAGQFRTDLALDVIETDFTNAVKSVRAECRAFNEDERVGSANPGLAVAETLARTVNTLAEEGRCAGHEASVVYNSGGDAEVYIRSYVGGVDPAVRFLIALAEREFGEAGVCAASPINGTDNVGTRIDFSVPPFDARKRVETDGGVDVDDETYYNLSAGERQ